MWAKKIQRELALSEIIARDTNRAFEGDAKMGNTVKILTAETATIGTYTPGTDITIETKPGIVVSLPINQFKYFAFNVDDVEKAQALPEMQSAYIETAKNGLVNDSEGFLAGLAAGVSDAAQIVAADVTTPDEALAAVDSALQKLYDNKVAINADTVIEISPKYYGLLRRKIEELSTNNPEFIKTGEIGRYGGAKVKMTAAFGTEAQTVHNLFVRTKNSIAYVSKVTNLETTRMEKQFADLVRGLHVYGGVISRPKELVVVKADFDPA